MTAPIAQGPLDRKVRRMVETEREHYISDDGWEMRREYGMTPNGNPMNGRWVLRDERGEMIDFDRYQNDLAEHYRLKLETPNVVGKGPPACGRSSDRRERL